eukprot:TRINITY_DN3283_c0_g1_i1.p1 TRINITY_DN3283_c0_g1~~TRINITY_DN3283_c0_g1_i1.p1  ORF type:complete len:181 (+),score=18.14 TRINITY_DN3283_c0_g1_i1:376-918(+)
MSFLVEHGFDFNRLFRDGISFCARRPSDKSHNHSHHVLFSLMDRITSFKKPLILHNGLFDIMFLYHSFIDELPPELDLFTAKLHDSFPPIYDTKYIADQSSETITYLEYLYNKSKRKNDESLRSSKNCIVCEIPETSSSSFPKQSQKIKNAVCRYYSTKKREAIKKGKLQIMNQICIYLN